MSAYLTSSMSLVRNRHRASPEFYVLPTAVLDARERSQHSITIPSLKARRGEPVRFDWITGAVARAAGEQARD